MTQSTTNGTSGYDLDRHIQEVSSLLNEFRTDGSIAELKTHLDSLRGLGSQIKQFNFGQLLKNPSTGQGGETAAFFDPDSFPYLDKETAYLIFRLPLPNRYCTAFAQWSTMKGWQIAIGQNSEEIDPKILDEILNYKIPQFQKEGTTISSYFSEAQIKANVGDGKVGGAALLLDVDDGRTPDKEIDYKNVKSINGVYLLSHDQIVPDLNSFPYFLEPNSYLLQLGLPSSPDGLNDDQAKFLRVLTQLRRIDASRVVPFYGAKYISEIRREYYNGWGGSLLPLIYHDFVNYTTSSQAIARFIQTSSTVLVKIDQFYEKLVNLNANGQPNPDTAKHELVLAKLKQEIKNIVEGLTLWGGAAIDKGRMEIDYANRSSNGLDSLHGELRVNLVGGGMGLPHSIVWGQVPNGWGATRDHEMKPWGVQVASFQQSNWAAGLIKWYSLVFAIKSNPTRGVIPKDFKIKFISVQDISEETESNLRATTISNCIQLFNTVDSGGRRAMSLSEVRENVGQSELRTDIILNDALYQKDLAFEQQAALQAQFGGGFEGEEPPSEELSPEELPPEEPTEVEEEQPIQQDSAKPVKKRFIYKGITIALEALSGDRRFNRELKEINYGHVVGSKGRGADGDALDIYVHDRVLADPYKTYPLYRLTQLKNGEFDEYKFMLGFTSSEEAKRSYLSVMPTTNFGGIDKSAIADLRSTRKDAEREDAKETRGATYIHASAVDTLDKSFQNLIARAKSIASDEVRGADLYKIPHDRASVSFLFYPDFWDDPHPGLARSVRVNLKTEKVSTLNYTNNRPILHRKETFISPDRPEYAKFKKQTDREEEQGLLSSNEIGNEENWKQIKLKSKKRKDDYTTDVNATDTGAGAAFGGTPACIRILKTIAPRSATILDFGAGRNAIGTGLLKKAGFKSVTAYDIGENATDLIDPDALKRKYQIVVASNVLNVQPDATKINSVLSQIGNAIASGGYALLNYPINPRKSGLSGEKVRELLEAKFGRVEVIEGGDSAPVFRVWKTAGRTDSEPSNLDLLIDKQLEESRKAIAPLWTEATSWLDNRGSFEEALSSLDDLYLSLNGEEVERTLSEGAIASELMGREEILEDGIDHV